MSTRVERTESKRQPSRSVSLLTPEQLQRKREQDRESQRQTRIRVKQTIAELEARVEILTQQLHATRIENDTLRAHRRHRPSPPRSVHDSEIHTPPAMDITLRQKLCPTPFSPVPQHFQPSSFMIQRSQDDGTPDLLTHGLLPQYPFNEYITPQIPVQVWEARPCNVPASCDMDRVLLEATEARKAVQAVGGNVFEFQSDKFPSVSVVLSPEAHVNTHPLTSAIASGILYIHAISNLPQQIAAMYCMAMMLRWQVTGSQEDYDAMAEWQRPSAAQIVTAHPIWIDHFPWPRGRDRLCRKLQYDDKCDEIRYMCFNGISVNWPYDPADALLHLPGTNEYVINPVFITHIRNLENWTVSRELVDALPEFELDVNTDKSKIV